MSIIINESTNTFTLEGKSFSYIIGVDKYGYLNNLYYGTKLPHADLSYFKPVWCAARSAQIAGSSHQYDDLMSEYSFASTGDYRESALLAEDGKGSRVFDLKFEAYELASQKPKIASGIPVARGGETLIITVGDKVADLHIKLYYTVYESENIITRRAEAINGSGSAIKLLRALSMTLDLPESNYKMLELWGNHARERQIDCQPLRHGVQSIGSHRACSSHEYNPFFALLGKNADEDQGKVYGFALIYSGSHYEAVEVDNSERSRVVMGIDPFDFSWKLAPGESFETPEAVLCFSNSGLGEMSRSFHDFFRGYVINPKYVEASRPVVLNSWEGMHFQFDKKRIFGAIDDIKDSGIDTFVLDDGWFGKRNSSKSSLGDWYVNTEKLPSGLQGVADYCHDRGLNFGLWIEPEMISPDSDLFRAHPDWAISVPDHAPLLRRNQCILDFSRPDVVEYIKNIMYNVIRDSKADYIKWDMNRTMTENYSALLSADRQHETQHRYILGVYELASYLTESFPDILFEGCAGGGGRFDGAMLAFFPQIWTSDDTDAYERTLIQYGTSMCYPVSAMSNHVSICPNIRNGRSTPWQTRTDIAYCGEFGYEFDTKEINACELARIKDDIKIYRSIEHLVHSGDLYRVDNPFEGNSFCQVLVSKDKSEAMLTYFQTLNPHKGAPRVKFKGLDANRIYRIEKLDLELPGGVLENVGLVFPHFKGDFTTFTVIAKAK